MGRQTFKVLVFVVNKPKGQFYLRHTM